MKISRKGQNQVQIANHIDPLRHYPVSTTQPADYRQFVVKMQCSYLISYQVGKGA